MPRDLPLDDRTDRTLRLRKPEPTDGPAIWALIRACKPLDENSLYCNLVQAEHFSETCILAEREGEVLGWISGHMIPNEDALFIWQVAVSPKARGLGLGRRMLHDLVRREACRDARQLRTTITRDNQASWALFRSLARHLGGEIKARPHYTRAEHFGGRHATEHLVTIPLPPVARRASALRAA
ncbi:diaminobutyrate acetyltransferase [Paracoccus sp. NSM]|uniref:diaminobutyrate acetyltransferase n=1 Tax=Paracoccus sp. NSM TaxID=3457784 RepID=UPI004035EE2A